MAKLFIVLFSLSIISCASNKSNNKTTSEEMAESQQNHKFTYSALHTGRR